MPRPTGSFRKRKRVNALLLACAVGVLGGPAWADDGAEQHLKQAETQRQIVYAQLESKLTTEQKAKQEAAEKAWSRFTKLEVENQSQNLDRSTCGIRTQRITDSAAIGSWIPLQTDHGFRRNRIMDSAANGSPIPTQSDHGFRGKAIMTM